MAPCGGPRCRNTPNAARWRRRCWCSLGAAAQLVRNFKDVAVDQTSDRRRQFTLAHCITEIVQTFEAGAQGPLPQLVVDVPTELELDSYPVHWSGSHQPPGKRAHPMHLPTGPGARCLLRRRCSTTHGAHQFWVTTGSAFPQSDLPRIFDPFFTTRLGQGGSGLGLSIVYRLVTQTLGGRIQCQRSDTGRGAMFIIDLPLIARAAGGFCGSNPALPAAAPSEDASTTPCICATTC